MGGVKEGRRGTWQLYFVSKSAHFLPMRPSLRCSGSGTREAAEAPARPSHPVSLGDNLAIASLSLSPTHLQ